MAPSVVLSFFRVLFLFSLCVFYAAMAVVFAREFTDVIADRIIRTKGDPHIIRVLKEDPR